ncbi:MAG: 50S ribosomal protein L29 [Patescibacteria group bacterium]
MKDLIKKNDNELENLLSEKREALRSFCLNLTGSKTRDVKEGRGVRKEIAQILTLKKQRVLGISK